MEHYKNLLDKHNITKSELERAIEEAVSFGKVCNTQALLALVDLIANGDINVEKN